MQTALRNHIRSNVVGYVAVFIALAGGTAIAAGTKAPRNSVVSKSIKNGAVKGKDVKSSQVQLRVGGRCPAGEAIRVVNVDGGVLCEVDNEGAAGGSPSGPAGGSLAGVYPNPSLAANSVGTSQIADNAVDAAKVADNSLTGNDLLNRSLTNADVALNGLGGAEIDEATLGQVPSALLGGLGRDSVEGTCDPESTAFVTCASVNVTTPAPSRAFLFGRVMGFDPGSGFCRLGTSAAGPVPDTTVPVFGGESDIIPLNAVTGPLNAGAHAFGIDCTENTGEIKYNEAKISVLMISSD